MYFSMNSDFNNMPRNLISSLRLMFTFNLTPKSGRV